jgi:hypothetical protein
VAFLPRVGRKEVDTTETTDEPAARVADDPATTTAPTTGREPRFDREPVQDGAVAERRVERP